MDRMNDRSFYSLIGNPFKFRLFLIRNLPAAWFSGLKIKEINSKTCTVSIPYKWFTRNPFRSSYFASLSMAAEMSTGALAMAAIYKRKPAVSMLVTAMNGKFFKKATGITSFTCNEGDMLSEAVEKAIATSQPVSVTVRSSGVNAANELVAEFQFEWSFKVKSQQ